MLSLLADRFRERVRPWYLRNIYFKWVPGSKPDYFSSCWNFPEFSTPALPKPFPETSPTNDPVVIFLPMNDWHTRIQRTQHLARGLARRGFPVIYVNPHLGREFPRIFRRGETARLLRLESNLFELHIHLPREPVFHHRLLTGDESSRIAAAIIHAVAPSGYSRAVQIAAFPIWIDAALAIRAALSAPVIYDCHDYLPGFANVAREIVAREAALFRASDLILCTSDALIERAASLSSAPSVLLRNAAAEEFFAVRTQPAPQTQLKDRVTVGYAGALDSWFDAEALRYAAEARPEWRFELIGRVEHAAVSALSHLSNVHLAGEVPFAELPERLERFTAALIPFRLNPLIEATDPIKAYEYLACGLPVVASAMPELKRFGDLISFYTTSADFVDKLDIATHPQSPELQTRRRQFVQNETWESRGARLAELIHNLKVS